MTPAKRAGTGRLIISVVVTATLALVAVACDNDPFAIPWEESPDTVVLYSIARPELNLPSGFNLHTGVPIRIEAANATGNWDFAVDTRSGQMVLVPPTELGVSSRARVAPLAGRSFAEVTEAPADTTQYTAAAVPVEHGTIYVFRTSQGVGPFGTRCVYYAKVEALDIDVVGGTLRFRYDASPICNDRKLIPPD